MTTLVLKDFTDTELDDWGSMSRILFTHYGKLRRDEGAGFPPCDKRRQDIVSALMYDIWKEERRRRNANKEE